MFLTNKQIKDWAQPTKPWTKSFYSTLSGVQKISNNPLQLTQPNNLNPLHPFKFQNTKSYLEDVKKSNDNY